MFWFLGSFWVLIRSVVSRFFGFVLGYSIRFLGDGNKNKDEESREKKERNVVQADFDCFEEPGFNDLNEDQEFGELGFTCISRYQVMNGKDFNGFVEEPQTMSVTVRELYSDSNDEDSHVSDAVSGKDLWEFNLEATDRRSDDFGLESQELNLETDESHDTNHEEAMNPAESGTVADKPDDFVQEYTENEEEHEQSDEFNDSEEPNSPEKLCTVDLDDEVESEVLREHRELIKRLKLEHKNARNSGLPTILEELESPKNVEDLKPLKMDEKLNHKDHVEEIQKFYKSYADKMRKLDILILQTLHAIEFIKLKDQVCGKPLALPTIRSILSQPFQQQQAKVEVKRDADDPPLKFIQKLHKDLETVYVTQLCLSWEILHWQYRKAREMQGYDPHGYRHYNQVADEFQQCQVLLRRFIENEAFQGPRVQNYAKKRCVLRNFLQVPAIKDDSIKDMKGGEYMGEDAITITMLADIIEESMRIFWEFLHADKNDLKAMILKGFQGIQAELQKPSDSEILLDVQTKLQKKERRIKDLLRSGNCIAKKFRKQRGGEDGVICVLLIAQVETGLVSRVLSMSRLTTDQLRWCSQKLSSINFVNRRLRVEPSFHPFPC